MGPAASMTKVDKTKENVKTCLCLSCPSYGIACQAKAMPKITATMMKSDLSGVEHMEKMFCAFGKSDCIDTQKGCICGDCEVHKKYDLNEGYYCLKDGGQQ